MRGRPQFSGSSEKGSRAFLRASGFRGQFQKNAVSKVTSGIVTTLAIVESSRPFAASFWPASCFSDIERQTEATGTAHMISMHDLK